jgi:hypothetical protein
VNPNDLFTAALAANPDAGKTQEVKPMPEGVYPLVVESIEQRKYVDGVGRKPEQIAEACCADPHLVPGDEISMTFCVVEGEFAKRKIFGNYTTKSSSNQRCYGDFDGVKKAAAGINDLCGLRARLGTPEKWSDWIGQTFNGYVTAKMGKPKLDGKGDVLEPGKVRNDLRCTIKPGEDIAPRPSKPKTTTTVSAPDEPPF